MLIPVSDKGGGGVLALGLAALALLLKARSASAATAAAAAPPGTTPAGELAPSDVPQADPYNLGGGMGFVSSSQPASTIDGVRSGARVSGLSGALGGSLGGTPVVQTGAQVVPSTYITQSVAVGTADRASGLPISPTSLLTSAPRVYSLVAGALTPAAPEVSGALSISQVVGEPALSGLTAETPAVLGVAAEAPALLPEIGAFVPSAEIAAAVAPIAEVGALVPSAEIGATGAVYAGAEAVSLTGAETAAGIFSAEGLAPLAAFGPAIVIGIGTIIGFIYGLTQVFGKEVPPIVAKKRLFAEAYKQIQAYGGWAATLATARSLRDQVNAIPPMPTEGTQNTPWWIYTSSPDAGVTGWEPTNQNMELRAAYRTLRNALTELSALYLEAKGAPGPETIPLEWFGSMGPVLEAFQSDPLFQEEIASQQPAPAEAFQASGSR